MVRILAVPVLRRYESLTPGTVEQQESTREAAPCAHEQRRARLMLALSGVGDELESLVDMTGAIRFSVLFGVGGGGDACTGEKDGGGE